MARTTAEGARSANAWPALPAGLALGLLGAATSLSAQMRLHSAADGWVGFEGRLLAVHVITGLLAGVVAVTMGATGRLKNPVPLATGMWLALWSAVVVAFTGMSELFQFGVYLGSVSLALLLVMLALLASMLVGGFLFLVAAGMIARVLRLRPEALSVGVALGASTVYAMGLSIGGVVVGLVAVALASWIFTKAGSSWSRLLWAAAILAVVWIAPAANLYRAHGARPAAMRAGIPNVVLVVVDTLRADHVTGLPASALELPALRKLVGKGFLFNKTVATSSFTVASTASILTALTPHHHGARTHPSDLAEGVTTLAEILQENGYATGGVVCNGLLSWQAGFGQGFESFVNLRSGVLDSSPAVYLANMISGFFEDATDVGDVPDFRRLRWMFKGEPDHDAIATRLAIDWLDDRADGPFFLWVHYFGPHLPYEPRPRDDDGDARQAGLENFGVIMREYYLGSRTMGSINFEGPLSQAGLAAGAYLYGREVEQVDGEIGQLAGYLESKNLLENTIFVVTSDHGESLGEHGLAFAHAFYVYDASTVVPLLFSWPGEIVEGMESDAQVGMLDIMPTILELAGVESAPGEGSSLTGSLRGGAAPKTRPLLSESIPLLPRFPERKRIHLEGNAGKMRALREFPWKLIATPTSESVDWGLYRLDEDPGEETNLAGSGAEVESGLMATMLAILELEAAKEAQDRDEPIDEDQLELLKSLGYIN